MAYFVQGLGYGLMAVGWVLAFGGGIMLLVSFGAFLTWIGDMISPEDHDGGEE